MLGRLGPRWPRGFLGPALCPDGVYPLLPFSSQLSQRSLRHASNKQQMLKGFVFSPPKSSQSTLFTSRPGLGGPLGLPGTVCMEAEGWHGRCSWEGCRCPGSWTPGLCLQGHCPAPHVQGPSHHPSAPLLPSSPGTLREAADKGQGSQPLPGAPASLSSAVPGPLELRPFF